MSLGAVAAGADGLLLEVHTNLDMALSDKEQTISTVEFGELMEKLRRIGEAIGRRV